MMPFVIEISGEYNWEPVCECGDWQSDHQGGGPCDVCCQSRAPYDGCEVYRFYGWERHGLSPYEHMMV